MRVSSAVSILEAGATEHALSSELHGVDHWKRVALAGIHLAERVPDVDGLVLLLFAMIHDSQRLNDGHDPLHGPRAASFAGAFASLLAPVQLDILVEACRDHAGGRVSSQPTIGACFDADRLNLWRVGIAPSAAFLSTAVAREPGTIAWAGGLQAAPVPSWAELGDRLLD